jgi:hypothetical protein
MKKSPFTRFVPKIILTPDQSSRNLSGLLVLLLLLFIYTNRKICQARVEHPTQAERSQTLKTVSPSSQKKLPESSYIKVITSLMSLSKTQKQSLQKKIAICGTISKRLPSLEDFRNMSKKEREELIKKLLKEAENCNNYVYIAYKTREEQSAQSGWLAQTSHMYAAPMVLKPSININSAQNADIFTKLYFSEYKHVSPLGKASSIELSHFYPTAFRSLQKGDFSFRASAETGTPLFCVDVKSCPARRVGSCPDLGGQIWVREKLSKRFHFKGYTEKSLWLPKGYWIFEDKKHGYKSSPLSWPIGKQTLSWKPGEHIPVLKFRLTKVKK